jgi:hypothetical protein
LGCTLIKELPEDLTVGRDLDLCYSDIKELPEDLTVGGDLNLSNTLIKELPEGLMVGGDLNLSHNTPIKELPEDLTVGGRLINSTTITELPLRYVTVTGDTDTRVPFSLVLEQAKKDNENIASKPGGASVSNVYEMER